MEPATLPSTVILMVGHDPALLNTRGLLLRSVGYIVTSTASTQEAIELFQAGDFDLVVLCHSLPEQDREHLIQAIRNGGSATPVLFVIAANVSSPDRFADLSSGSEPDGLLKTIRKVLQIKSVSALAQGRI